MLATTKCYKLLNQLTDYYCIFMKILTHGVNMSVFYTQWIHILLRKSHTDVQGVCVQHRSFDVQQIFKAEAEETIAITQALFPMTFKPRLKKH
jgi:hypothetical protein